MPTRIYVGNLPSSATAAEIRQLFSAFGTVEWVNLVTEPDSDRSRGFGYVEMSSGARDAIRMLNHLEMAGRCLQVRRALPPCGDLVSRPRAPRRTREHRPSGACIRGLPRAEENRQTSLRQLAL